jgi:hypothetical protein
MFQTVSLQTLANFGHLKGYHFAFQNSEDWKSMKIQIEQRAHMSVAPAA